LRLCNGGCRQEASGSSRCQHMATGNDIHGLCPAVRDYQTVAAADP
jgi:hypothetical protein